MVSADGQHSVALNVGDTVHIRKHPFKLSLLHPPVMIFIWFAVLNWAGIKI